MGFDFGLIADSLPLLLRAAGLTIEVTVISLVIGLIIGTLTALARVSGSAPLRWLAVTYTELIRGTPLLVQLFLIYFGLPQLVQAAAGSPWTLDAKVAGILAFSLNSGAYCAEIIRSGIQGVGRGQSEAALSLGLSPKDTMRYVVLPQAFRRVLPPLVNEAMTLLKNTSLLSAIALTELTQQGKLITARTYKPFEMYLTVSAIYLVMTLSLSLLARWAEKRWSKGEQR